MVLVVGIVILDHDVEHGAGVLYDNVGLLGVGGGDGVFLREGLGKNAPDTISVQLKRSTNLWEGRLGYT